MATSQQKADAYIKRVDTAAGQASKELGIALQDIDLRISVRVETSVKYDLHEDED